MYGYPTNRRALAWDSSPMRTGKERLKFPLICISLVSIGKPAFFRGKPDFGALHPLLLIAFSLQIPDNSVQFAHEHLRRCGLFDGFDKRVVKPELFCLADTKA